MSASFQRGNKGSFHENSNILSVFHGTDAFLLEDELNESQWNQIEARAEQMKIQYTSGILSSFTLVDKNTYAYLESTDGKPFNVLVDGYVAKVGGNLTTNPDSADNRIIFETNQEATNNADNIHFIEFWFEVIDHGSVVRKFGGVDTATITNNMWDNRINTETSRRVQLKWKINYHNSPDLTTNGWVSMGDNLYKKVNSVTTNPDGSLLNPGVSYAVIFAKNTTEGGAPAVHEEASVKLKENSVRSDLVSGVTIEDPDNKFESDTVAGALLETKTLVDINVSEIATLKTEVSTNTNEINTIKNDISTIKGLESQVISNTDEIEKLQVKTNAVDLAQAEIARKTVHSGFNKLGNIEYLPITQNAFKLSANEILVNGYQIKTAEGLEITLPAAPSNGYREDFVFLEAFWTLKNVGDSVYLNNNVDSAVVRTVVIPEHIFEYRIRVIPGVDFSKYKLGFTSDLEDTHSSSYNNLITPQGGNVAPIPFNTDVMGTLNNFSSYKQRRIGDSLNVNIISKDDVGLFVAGSIDDINDPSQLENKKSLYKTIDGRVYAIPLFRVKRRNSFGYNESNLNGAVDYPAISDRPDGKLANLIYEDDIMDLRCRISLTGENYQQLLEENFNKLLRGELETKNKVEMTKERLGLMKASPNTSAFLIPTKIKLEDGTQKELTNLLGVAGEFEYFDGKVPVGWSMPKTDWNGNKQVIGDSKNGLSSYHVNGYDDRSIMFDWSNHKGKYVLIGFWYKQGSVGTHAIVLSDVNVQSWDDTSGKSIKYIYDGTNDWKFGYTKHQVTYNHFAVSAETESDSSLIDSMFIYEIDKSTFDKIDVDPLFTGENILKQFPYTTSYPNIVPAPQYPGDKVLKRYSLPQVRNGKRFVKKLMKTIEIDGSSEFDWNINRVEDHGENHKSFFFTRLSDFYGNINLQPMQNELIRFDNVFVDNKVGYSTTVETNKDKDSEWFVFGGTSLDISVSDAITGFVNYIPTEDDVRAFFNGWKYIDGNTWTSLTGSGEVGTQANVYDERPDGFTPYRLTYLANTIEELEFYDCDTVYGRHDWLNDKTPTHIDTVYNFSQRKTWSDAQTSENIIDVVSPISNIHIPHIETKQATKGIWTVGDEIQINAVNGIISGVIDSDTAMARIVKADDSDLLVVNDISKLSVGDTVRLWHPNSPNLVYFSAIDSIDDVSNALTMSDAIESVFTGGYIIETTISSSSPVAKSLGLVGTWTDLGTAKALFTITTAPTSNTSEIDIQYSINYPVNNGIKNVPLEVLGANVNGLDYIKNNVFTLLENFENKIFNSEVENPHTVKTGTSTNVVTTIIPANGTEEDKYDVIKSLDGNLISKTSAANNSSAYSILSFNLLEAIERNIGNIPNSLLADKITWLKNNINQLIMNWHGYGNGPLENNATIMIWNTVSQSWTSPTSLISGIVAKIEYEITNLTNFIDVDGYVRYLVYSDQSDGVIPSTINTDYVELLIKIDATEEGYDVFVPKNEKRVLINSITKFVDNQKKLNVVDFYTKTNGLNFSKASEVKSNDIRVPSDIVTNSITEFSVLKYNSISSTNGALVTTTSDLTDGMFAQQLFEFDLSFLGLSLKELKKVLKKLTVRWNGYGKGNNAGTLTNGAIVKILVNGNWTTVSSNSGNFPSQVIINTNDVSLPINLINTEQKFYVLVHSLHPASTTISSELFTDYISLEIDSADWIDQVKKNIVKINPQTKEIKLQYNRKSFKTGREDEVEIFYNHLPVVKPIEAETQVTILAESDGFLLSDLATSVGHKQGSHHWLNPLYKVANNRPSLFGDFGFAKIPFSIDTAKANIGSLVTVNSKGFFANYTQQYGLQVIKKPKVAIASYLVLLNGELNLLIISDYSDNENIILNGASDNVAILIPVDGRILVKIPEGIVRSGIISPNTWLTNTGEIQGYLNSDGQMIATYQ